MTSNTSCLFSRVFNKDPLSRCNIIKNYFNGDKGQHDIVKKQYTDHVKKYGVELLKYNIDLNNSEEWKKRFVIFLLALRFIEAHNNNPSNTWALEINLFTIFENSEVPKGLIPHKVNVEPDAEPDTEPDTKQFENFSWSNNNGKNYVSSPKNQGNLGVCWCFAGVEAIETVNAINNSLEVASVQNVLDVYSNNSINQCSTGCYGNILEAALYICGDKSTTDGDNSNEYIKCNNGRYALKEVQSGGIEQLTSENKYVSKCPNSDTQYDLTNILSGTCVDSFDLISNITVANLKSLLKKGPVLAGIYTGSKSFHYYKEGVLSGKELYCGADVAPIDCGGNKGCTVSPDHAILIIGYGYDETLELNYWLCKNSWGTDWGITLPDWALADQTNTKGYFKVEASPNNVICIQGQVAGNIKLKKNNNKN
jgi:hypothetical protein